MAHVDSHHDIFSAIPLSRIVVIATADAVGHPWRPGHGPRGGALRGEPPL